MQHEPPELTTSTHPYDQLTPEVILDALEEAGFAVSGRLFALNSYENRVYQIGLDDGPPVIAKFYRPCRWSEAAIREEHKFSLALQQADIPVVAPLVMPGGDTLGQHQAFLFAVFPQRGGQAPDTSVTDTLYRLGQWLGQIHNLGALKSFNHRPGFDLIQGLEEHNALLVNGGWVPDDLRPAWDSLIPDLIAGCRQRMADAGTVDTLRIHGDCHAGNILCRDESMLFVDLDDCRTGPAVQDMWLLLNGEASERGAQLGELIEGYEMFRDFDRRERHLIEPLRCYRQIAHCAWLARRWEDPAFPRFFPWFAQPRFWSDQVLALREQLSALQEPAISLPGQF
ncbi:MAG: serine/threonine protein kinase [Marinobacter sp.]|uniref:serine/threonine protein kinase n=1 Tax=Marinobacter sp. TaxID=50741 RepID=UPI0029C36A82|nr:serine/threonine protein kinase [Marinobacter sp.]MDX5336128.1 serine/threonine protein kinase [Marinobacter sp.]MDX5387168.1 serine/threonine protein kinase [Marinobacter sp.]MDX5441183.1 serine/threonine protein kinase [Alteromonadaceae bacterium]MDX5472543.1 serine/threonine protein kinase [Marinobacter sp.]